MRPRELQFGDLRRRISAGTHLLRSRIRTSIQGELRRSPTVQVLTRFDAELPSSCDHVLVLLACTGVRVCMRESSFKADLASPLTDELMRFKFGCGPNRNMYVDNHIISPANRQDSQRERNSVKSKGAHVSSGLRAQGSRPEKATSRKGKCDGGVSLDHNDRIGRREQRHEYEDERRSGGNV